jgi:hypothetical protein
LQLTASLVKTLAFVRPGGHALVCEWDIFYPLPNTWHIEKKKKPPVPPPPTSPSPLPEKEEVEEETNIESWDEHKHPGEIWVPSGGWSSDSDVIKSISDEKRRVWSELNVSEEIIEMINYHT